MTEVMTQILAAVSEVTEVEKEKITMRCKREDYVLARKLFVNFCIKYGFATAAISECLHYSKRGTRNLFVTSIKEDSRYIYGKYYEEIKNKLRCKLGH